ncbi:MAG: hypothetical protein QXH55_03675 [Candidatus Korarchaeota archaeon]|nr:hypothetical protein [Thermoproteota archaeon]MCR8463338.1 hypothetical protein [Thermoproteota archaeon]MCR8470611.1 hypothetical protein [Thermoproteota archaeon]MCR8472401.1 hypothetical protein [Thermoproteota archaeon]MCR8473158.1 hypothetical protein [Thermoproteota archaeon]
MIYFVSIVDVESEGGISKWHFIHPETPEALRKRLYEYRDLISSFAYAIIRAFGSEIIGEKLRELKLSDVQIVFSTIEHKGRLYYVIFIADIRDNSSAVDRIFTAFYKKYYKDFDSILSGPIINTTIVDRLKAAFAQFLFPHARQNPLLGARDLRHFIISYLMAVAITGLLAFMTWVINRIPQPSLMNTNPILFALIVFLLIFVAPGIPIGMITQYRRFAFAVAYMDSLTITLISLVVWRDLLLSYASFAEQYVPDVTILLAIGAILIGAMLGTMLMFISYGVAWYFEARRLTSVRSLITLGAPIEKKPPTELEEVEIPSPEEVSSTEENP